MVLTFYTSGMANTENPLRTRLHRHCQHDLNQYTKPFIWSKKNSCELIHNNHLYFWQSLLFDLLMMFCTSISANKDHIFWRRKQVILFRWANKCSFVGWGVGRDLWLFFFFFRSVGMWDSPDNQTITACLLPVSVWLMARYTALHWSTAHYPSILLPIAGGGGRAQKIYDQHNGWNRWEST